jgi:hypothetical protein
MELPGSCFWKFCRARAGSALLVLLSLSSSATAGAGQDRPPGGWAGSWLKCNEALIYSRQALPPAVKLHAKQLIEQLHPAKLIAEPELVEKVCGFTAKPWRYSADAVVAVYETAVYKPSGFGGADEVYRTLAIAVLKVPAKGGALSVTAKTAEPLRLQKEIQLDRLDLARYQLNEKETAFGLRTIKYFAYGSGGGADAYLQLFRVNDGVVSLVLSTLISSSSMIKGEWNKGGSRERRSKGSEKDAVIRVLPQKSNGMFDLEKASGGKHAVFRWNGKEYATTDAEPVDKVNEDE